MFGSFGAQRPKDKSLLDSRTFFQHAPSSTRVEGKARYTRGEFGDDRDKPEEFRVEMLEGGQGRQGPQRVGGDGHGR